MTAVKPDPCLLHFFWGGGGGPEGGGGSLAIAFYLVSIYGIQRAPFVHLIIQFFFFKLSFKDSVHTSDPLKNEKPFK